MAQQEAAAAGAVAVDGEAAIAWPARGEDFGLSRECLWKANSLRDRLDLPDITGYLRFCGGYGEKVSRQLPKL